MKIKTKLSTFDNSWYKSGNFVQRVFWYYTNIIFFKNPFITSYTLKRFLLRLFGAKVGKGVVIKPSVNIKFPWLLEIGDYVWIGENVWIDNLDKVSIGNNACISQGALLLNGNHNYKKSSFDLIVKPIVIEEGVWIGARATVCQGVRCKSHAVLTAGSVTAKDLLPYSIYQGNPATKIRERVME